MVQEAYVTFEVAKLLRDKGFDTPSYITGHVYSEHGTLQSNTSFRSVTMDYITACTQQMAMRWLREEHNLSIEISSCCTVLEGKASESFWAARIIDRHKILDNPLLVGNRFSKYEEACEAAIKCCLENLI